MADERNVAHDKKVMAEENVKELKLTGEHPEHAPQPGKKTRQTDEPDKDAIDESGKPIYDDGKDENDAK